MVVQALQSLETSIRLVGVDQQRLLLHGVKGPWRATIEIEGNAGPELAAEMDAPFLRVVCRGSVADGAGRALHSGRLIIAGDAGVAVGYAQLGGTIAVRGNAGARAGLEQSGGLLILSGTIGPLAGERQRGGCLLRSRTIVGPNSGRGRRGGTSLVWDEPAIEAEANSLGELAWIRDEVRALGQWLPAQLVNWALGQPS